MRAWWSVGSVVFLAACSGQVAPSSSGTPSTADGGSACAATVSGYCAAHNDPMCAGLMCPDVDKTDVYVEDCGGFRSVVLAGIDFSTSYYFDPASGSLVAVVANTVRGDSECVAGPSSGFAGPAPESCDPIQVPGCPPFGGCAVDTSVPCAGDSPLALTCDLTARVPGSSSYACSIPRSNPDGTSGYCCLPVVSSSQSCRQDVAVGGGECAFPSYGFSCSSAADSPTSISASLTCTALASPGTYCCTAHG